MPKSKLEDILPKKHAEPQRKAAVTMGDTVFAVVNKLAGEGNNLKIDFDRLTVGMGPMEATVDGTLKLDVLQLAK